MPQEQPPGAFQAVRAPQLTITVNETARYQNIEGFGASLTDSSAWLLAKKLTDGERKEWLERLFDRQKGIGLNLLRQPMGVSDFSVEGYTYDDIPAGDSDARLEKFSIEKDERYILPLLKEILAVNADVKVIATPWSPPAWMKTSQSLVKGTLEPKAYPALADYFVRFVEAYRKAGVPIFAITVQNEPLNIPKDYAGMGMSSAEQAKFLSENLGPAFRKSNVKTRIFIFDHNWSLLQFPLEILAGPAAAKYISGVATHCYEGNASAQSEIHERYPNVPIWMTECSDGDWLKGNLLVQQVRLIIDSMRNWSQTVILWNLALDQNHEPHLGGCTNCRAVLTVRTDTAQGVTPTVDYTALALASEFVQRGAVRIDSNTFGNRSLEDVAFQNPDGSIVLLVLNSSPKPIAFNIAWAGKYAVYTLKAFTAATFVWQLPRHQP